MKKRYKNQQKMQTRSKLIPIHYLCNVSQFQQITLITNLFYCISLQIIIIQSTRWEKSKVLFILTYMVKSNVYNKQNIIINMTEELNSEFLRLFSQEITQPTDLVQLRLIKPRINDKIPTITNILQLKENCTLIKSFKLSDPQSQQSNALILYFQSVQDALDFLQDKTISLTYATVFIHNQENQLAQEKANHYYEPHQLQQQIQQEGFYIEKGTIHLKKITSIEELIGKNLNQNFEQQSTIVNSQHKTSNSSQFNININEQLQDREHQPEAQETDYMKPITESLVYAGVFYGGLKLLKYLMKF